MQKGIKDAGEKKTHLNLSACPVSLAVLAAEGEEWWKRRGRLSQPLPALIIPKDQFSDH